jgi:hypothetical protein
MMNFEEFASALLTFARVTKWCDMEDLLPAPVIDEEQPQVSYPEIPEPKGIENHEMV